MANRISKHNICHFTFTAAHTNTSIDVTGVERTWKFLKSEFERCSDGLPSQTASYYQTLYAGPRLFAVDDNDQVFYHDQEKWFPYSSGRDVTYSYDPDFVESIDERDDIHSLSIDFNNQHIINDVKMPLNNVQWYFIGSENSMLGNNENDHWLAYSDIEREIIEDAFQQNFDTSSLVELDDYRIDLKQMVQISKLDNNKQKSIKRATQSNDQRVCHVRERFSEPPKLILTESHTCGRENEWCPFMKQWMQSKAGKRCLFNARHCVRKAIEGILTEGRLIQKEIEAKQLVKELETYSVLTIYEASKYCVRMFTRESFLYKLVNKVLRDNDSNKVDTLGPYCYLLRAYIRLINTDYSGDLYRGCNLLATEINQYCNAASTKEWKTWSCFTSTSKNQAVASAFKGNTFFIISVEKRTMFLVRAFDINSLSAFPDEEEVLLPAGALFKVLSVKEDKQEQHMWTIQLYI